MKKILGGAMVSFYFFGLRECSLDMYMGQIYGGGGAVSFPPRNLAGNRIFPSDLGGYIFLPEFTSIGHFPRRVVKCLII